MKINVELLEIATENDQFSGSISVNQFCHVSATSLEQCVCWVRCLFLLDACIFRPEGFERSFPLRSTRTSFGHLSEDEPDPSELESGLPDDDVPWIQARERERGIETKIDSK